MTSTMGNLLRDKETMKRFFELLTVEDKTTPEAYRIMSAEGIKVPLITLHSWRRKMPEILAQTREVDDLTHNILENYKLVVDKFQMLLDALEKKFHELENDENKQEQWINIVREMKGMLETAMKKQGLLNLGAINITENNTLNMEQRIIVLREEEEKLFDMMEPRITKDDLVIFTNTTPEFLERIRRWSTKRFPQRIESKNQTSQDSE